MVRRQYRKTTHNTFDLAQTSARQMGTQCGLEAPHNAAFASVFRGLRVNFAALEAVQQRQEN
jgi:hypothetical protein